MGEQSSPDATALLSKEELWEYRYRELVEFHRRYGHTRVPARWKNNSSLGRWLAHQRELQRIDELWPERVRDLEKLGVEWSLRESPTGIPGLTPQDSWKKRLHELGEFQREHGHTRIPRRWPANQSLSDWASRQRRAHQRGTLHPDHLRALANLGFDFTIHGSSIDDTVGHFEEMLRRLLAYRQRYGHTGVSPQRDIDLSNWIIRQRNYHRSGRMPAHRRERLTGAGFPWEPVDWRWEENFQRLRAFHAIFGHTQVPVKWKQDLSLGRWVAHQRELHHASQLRPENQRRLDTLGFRWGPLPPHLVFSPPSSIPRKQTPHLKPRVARVERVSRRDS